MQIEVHDTSEAAANAAAQWVLRRIRSAIRLRGGCDVAFSGGSTPQPMLAAIAAADLDWRSLYVWQVDERVAPDGDPARNVNLLDVLPLPRHNLKPMPVGTANRAAAARRYAGSLPERFDIVHLGLGDDGHTASWPPGDPVVDSPNAVALSESYNGFVRMTLTPEVVNAARARVVLAAGASKAPMVEGWLLHRADLPIERVRRADTTVFLDAPAAARLAHQSG